MAHSSRRGEYKFGEGNVIFGLIDRPGIFEKFQL
jgi:hypothetical protein